MWLWCALVWFSSCLFCLEFIELPELMDVWFSLNVKMLWPLFFQCLSVFFPTLCLSNFWDSSYAFIIPSMLTHSSLMLSSCFFSLILCVILDHFYWLSSSLQIFSPIVSDLLLFSSCVFFVLNIKLFHLLKFILVVFKKYLPCL